MNSYELAIIRGEIFMQKRGHRLFKSKLIKGIERAVDLIVVFGSIYIFAVLAVYFNDGSLPNIYDKLVETLNSILSYMLYMIIVFFLFRVFSPSVFERRYLSVMKAITLSLILANTLLIILTFIFGSKMLFNALGVIAVIFIQLSIFAIYKYITNHFFSRLILSEAIIIGLEQESNDLAIDFFEDKEHNKKLMRIVYEIDGKLPDDIFDVMKKVEDIYITSGLSEINKQMVLQHAIAHLSKDVHLIPKTYEIGLMKSTDEAIDDTLVLHIPMLRMTREQRIIKRTFDIIISGLLLFLLSPLFLVIAILIKMQKDGPVLYRQERYMRNNEVFSVCKFRSMSVIQEQEQYNKRATKDDVRITKIGKFLRATRIDELPQLTNVFMGSMSLVGPRPLIKEEVEEAMREIPEFYYRSNVKPGLTGLAQVKGKYDTPAKEKIRYDLLYVKKASFWFDLKILILTVMVIFSKGSVTEDAEHHSIQELLKQRNIPYVESKHYLDIEW